MYCMHKYIFPDIGIVTENKFRFKLKGRDPGINKLYGACGIHDIAFNKYHDSVRRNIEIGKLIERSWDRLKAHDDSRLAEKLDA